MAKRFLALAVIGFVAGSATAAPPPKDSVAIPDETVAAEAAGGTDVEQARARTKSSNNLKMIVLAVHNHHDATGRLPGDVYDNNGKAILSWRVQLLPFVEHAELFKEFKMDEPWDGKTNKALLEKMPDIFASPRVKVKTKGYTVYQGFAGKGALFGSNKEL